MRPRTVALVAVAALLVAPVATPAAGSPSPRPVCPVCGDALAETVDDGLLATAGVDRPLDLAVNHSEVTVDVRADGTAVWTVESRLVDPATARYLRTHPDRRHDLVAAVLRRTDPDVLPPSAVSEVRTRVDGGTLVVRFRHAGFAERRPGGVLFGDYLHSGRDYWFRLTADRLTVRPPRGYGFATRPAGADVTGGGATWVGYGEGVTMPDVYLVLARGEGPTATLAAWAALAGPTLPALVADVPWDLPAAVVFGGVVVVLGHLPSPGGRNGRRDGDADARARNADARADGAGLGLLATGLVLAGSHLLAPDAPAVAGLEPSLPALALLFASVGFATPARRLAAPGAARTRLLALPVVVVALVAVGRLLATTPVPGAAPGVVGRHALRALPALLAGLLAPYGYAVGRGGRSGRGGRAGRWALGAAAVVLVVGLWWSGPFQPPDAHGVATVRLSVVGAVLGAAAGYPPFVVGRLVAATGNGGG